MRAAGGRVRLPDGVTALAVRSADLLCAAPALAAPRSEYRWGGRAGVRAGRWLRTGPSGSEARHAAARLAAGAGSRLTCQEDGAGSLRGCPGQLPQDIVCGERRTLGALGAEPGRSQGLQ